MGDINLLGMIRKIKNSISGFVSTSDKATKSKFGIVKIGDGINVSSGTISVPQNSGGMELLYTQPEAPEAVSTEITLAHAVSDYKFLLIVENGTSDPASTITMLLSCEVSPYWAIGIQYGGSSYQIHKFTVDGAKLKDVSSPNNANCKWFRVYGIK